MKLENITNTITMAWILNILSSILYTLLFTENVEGSKGYEIIFAVVSLLMFIVIFPLIKFILKWLGVRYVIPKIYQYVIIGIFFLLGIFGISLYPLILLLLVIQFPEALTNYLSYY